MSNHLSIVNIISDIHKEIINDLAEVLGMGPDNLSIKLQDINGKIFWGCHSWWSSEKYIIFKDLYTLENMGVDVAHYKGAIRDLLEFVINTENMETDQIVNIPNLNWNNALTELGLTLFTEETS